MCTITETTSTTTAGARQMDRTRVRRRRRDFGRAFALGAAISALAIGGAWTVTSNSTGGDQASQNGTPSASLTTSRSSGPGGSRSGSATGVPSDQHGAWVVALQHELAQLNYYDGPADGLLGPATLAAITNFQRTNRLPADGIASASTMAKIHQQLVTGDSQTWPTAPPVKPATSTPSNGSGKSASTTTTGSTTPTAGTSTNGGQSGASSATASATTTSATGGTRVAP
ncbi:MAG: peptidoglycan-binding domain-containing protein [Solirubrobacteraceae bacterium]